MDAADLGMLEKPILSNSLGVVLDILLIASVFVLSSMNKFGQSILVPNKIKFYSAYTPELTGIQKAPVLSQII
jgi:hypothetical protein